MVGTIAVVPQIADAVRVPVIASGGIMDGRGIAAVLALGASAVQMGTAFSLAMRAPQRGIDNLLNSPGGIAVRWPRALVCSVVAFYN